MIRVIAVAGALISGLTAIGAASAQPQSAPVQRAPRDQAYYAPAWRVQPQAAPEARKTVAGQRALTEVRLVPVLMVVNAEAVVDQSGAQVLAAGTELMAMAPDGRVACTLGRQRRDALNAILMAGTDRHTCLFDEDGDGAADNYFLIRHGNNTRYYLAGRVPRLVTPIQSVPLTITPSEQATQVPRLQVRLNSTRGPSGCVLGLFVGEGDFWTQLLDWPSLAQGSVPGAFNLLGGNIEVFRCSEGSIDFALTRPFAPENIRFNP